MTETEIQAGILHVLQYVCLLCWRQGSGRIQLGHRFIHTGKPGLGDIGGVLLDGRHFEIECKTPTGRLSPHQKSHLERVRSCGGVALVMRTEIEAVRFALSHLRDHYERYIRWDRVVVLGEHTGRESGGSDGVRDHPLLHPDRDSDLAAPGRTIH